jgi:hypothetical protein
MQPGQLPAADRPDGVHFLRSRELTVCIRSDVVQPLRPWFEHSRCDWGSVVHGVFGWIGRTGDGQLLLSAMLAWSIHGARRCDGMYGVQRRTIHIGDWIDRVYALLAGSASILDRLDCV